MRTVPMNWPIGDGPDFRGVYDLRSGTVHLYDRTEHGAKRAPVRVGSLHDDTLVNLIGSQRAADRSRIRP